MIARDWRAASWVGALASATGLAVVLGVMAVNAADGMDYAGWSWAATALVWPMGFAASVSVRRAPLLAPALMVAIGLGASILFVWEYGRIGGIPLAPAGGLLLAGRNQEAA